MGVSESEVRKARRHGWEKRGGNPDMLSFTAEMFQQCYFAIFEKYMQIVNQVQNKVQTFIFRYKSAINGIRGETQKDPPPRDTILCGIPWDSACLDIDAQCVIHRVKVLFTLR